MASPPDPASLDRPWVASYPPGVPPTYRLPAVRLPRLLDDAARDFPDQIGIVVDRDQVTFIELRRRVDALVRVLAGQHIGAGDRVLVMLPTGVMLPVVLVALWRLGAVAVPLPEDAPSSQVVALAADLEVEATIGSPEAVATLFRHGGAGRLAVDVSGDEWSGGRRLPRLRLPRIQRPDRWVAGLGTARSEPDAGDGPSGAGERVALGDLLADWTAGARPASVGLDPTTFDRRLDGADPDDRIEGPALLAVRLGPGAGNVVEHTHRTLLASAFQSRLWVPDVQAASERLLLAEPLHDVVGLAVGFLSAVLSAATTILLDDPGSSTLAKAVEHHEPTLLVARASRLAGILDERDAAKRDLTSLRVCLAIGDGLSPERAGELEARSAGARVRLVNGCGDAAPITHGQPVYGRIIPTTIGLPVTDTLAVVVDPDDPAVPCGAGETGMLLVRGPQIPDVGTACADGRSVDGWLVTERLARVDEGGWFTLIGTDDDVLRRGGDVVPAARIVAALRRHPDVTDAEVVLVDDLVVAAVVSARRRGPHPDDLTTALRSEFDVRSLPDRILLVTQLPRTDEHRVDRRALSGRLRDLLSGDVTLDDPDGRADAPDGQPQSPDHPAGEGT